MFRIGQRVVCVDAAGSGALIKGAEYTVLAWPAPNFPEFVAVDCWGTEWVGSNEWEPRRFRPVVEKKTDISWAEEILRRESIDAPERVS